MGDFVMSHMRLGIFRACLNGPTFEVIAPVVAEI